MLNRQLVQRALLCLLMCWCTWFFCSRLGRPKNKIVLAQISDLEKISTNSASMVQGQITLTPTPTIIQTPDAVQAGQPILQRLRTSTKSSDSAQLLSEKNNSTHSAQISQNPLPVSITQESAQLDQAYVQEAQQHSAVVSITQRTPEKKPEEFFIAAEEVEGAEIAQDQEEVSQNKTPELIVEKDDIQQNKSKKKLSTADPDLAQSAIEKTLRKVPLIKNFFAEDTYKEVDFLSYLVLRNEKNQNVSAISRSQVGLQQLIIKQDTLAVELWQAEHLKPQKSDWQLYANSTPVYQYQNEAGEWQDYGFIEVDEIQIEQFEDYSLVTQHFVLEMGVTGRNILKIGFDGSTYFSKWTFNLDENENVNRLLWKVEPQLASATTMDEDQLELTNEVREVLINDSLQEEQIVVNWTDFLEEARYEQAQGQHLVYFHEEGKQGALNIDPTLTLTTPSSSIQVDVDNRYRAVLDTGNTGNFLQIYDRAEDDSSPDKVLEVQGPVLREGGTSYYLNLDNNRKTTILESTQTRVKIRVEGRLYSGSAYLTDSGSDDFIEVTEEYTFGTQGVFVSQQWNFKDGIGLDSSLYNDGLLWMDVLSDHTDAAHSDEIIYGDGESESTTSTDTSFSDISGYTVIQAAGSYQDVLIGISNGLDQSGGTANWYYDANTTGTVDRVLSRVQNTTISGFRSSGWYLFLKSQTDLDTEAEREGRYNDTANPDILSFTTGASWSFEDDPALEGLWYLEEAGDAIRADSSQNNNDLTESSGDTIAQSSDARQGSYSADFESDDTEDLSISDEDQTGLDITGDLTMSAWIKPESSTENMPFLSKYNTSSQRAYAIYLQSTNVLQIYISNDGSSYTTCTSTGTIADGDWAHIAVTVDVDSNISIYINGVFDNTASYTSGEIHNSTAAFMLGGREAGGGDFDGLIDEAAVFSRALSGSEIRSIYNRGIATHHNTQEGAYTIDASSFQIELDIDGGSNVSTLINNASGVSAGATSITVDSTTGFPSSGIAYIEGDKFSYTGTTGTTFTGISTSGALSIIDHDDNSVVSLSNRFNPYFKIRNYRDISKPSSVTIGGNSLTEGTDYNLDFKPLTNAFFADELLWYSTLDSEAAVTNPDVGSGAINHEASFVKGKYGNGLSCDTDGENIYFLSSSNFNKAKGAVELWIRPNWNHTDGVVHQILQIWTNSDNSFILQKYSDNDLFFSIKAGGTYSAENINYTDYELLSGKWYHIRIEWDDSASLADQQKIFINGVEPTHTNSSNDYNSSNLDLASYIHICDSSTTRNTDATIDELYIYGADSETPQGLAAGGDTDDSDEYLFDTTSDYTLDFDADDSNNRGEYLFVGSDDRFNGVNIDLETAGVTGSEDNYTVKVTHECNSFDEYYSTTTDSGDLSVSSSAGLGNTEYGLNFTVDDTNNIYANKYFTISGNELRYRFYIDPNGLTMADDDLFRVFFIGLNADPWGLSYVSLGYEATGTTYELQLESEEDDGTAHYTSKYNITDEPHYVEGHITRASSDVAGDGEAKFYIDGVLKETISDLDNYDLWDLIYLAQVGTSNGLDSGTSGTFYMDEVVVNLTGEEIGPVPAETNWEYWSSSGNPALEFPFYNDSNLQGLWYLEEAGDATRVDETDNSNDLTESSGDTIAQSSDSRQGSYSADFESSDTENLCISDASQTGLNITGNMTVSAWIKPETLASSTYYNIVAKYNSNGVNERSWYFSAYGTSLMLGVSSNGSSIYQESQTGSGHLSTGEWQHVTVVYNGSYIILYVNGIEEASGAYSSGLYNSSADFCIGSIANPSGYFDGLIDEVAIFDRALSANEIGKIYVTRAAEYAWRDLNVTETDSGASTFEADGNFYFNEPLDWQLYSVNGSTDLYYIRSHLESGSYTTDPIENIIKTDILNLQYLGNISSAEQTLFLGQNSSATVPSLATKLFDNEKTSDTTPDFNFESTDGDSDDIEYNIQIDDDEDFSSTVVDADSTTDSGFANTENGSDTHPFTEDQNIKYTAQSALSDDTTYHWRVRAKDPLGADTWSDWSEIRSFTVDTDQSSAQTAWFQTTDEQFEDDTLSGVAVDSGNDRLSMSTSSWWDGDWGERKVLTFDNSSQAENLSSFPVLVVLDSNNIDYSKVQDDYDDLRFVDSNDSTVLDYEVEEWNESGTSYVWVEVPQIDSESSSDYIYMYYDNSSTSTPGEDVSGTWDGSFAGVWHFNQTSSDYLDSTTNSNDSSAVSVTGRSDTGKIGTDTPEFDGTDDYITVADDDTLDLGSYTLEAWVNADDTDAWTTISAKGLTTTHNWYWVFYQKHLYNRNGYGTSGEAISSTTYEEDGSWIYVTAVVDESDSEIRLYKNGTEVSYSKQSWGGNSDNNANDLQIGKNDEWGEYFDGHIDEFRVSSSARSDAWIAAQYKSMNNDSFVSFGSAQEYGGTALSEGMDYSWATDATGWSSVSWSDDETNGDIKIKVYYDDSGTPTIIPDEALTGNSTGFDTSPVDISGLNTTTYSKLYLYATFAYSSGSPYLNDWTISASSNSTPNSPQTPYVNDTTAQSGQATPVTGLTDHTPAFSAVFDDDDTSDTAEYYEIEVGDDGSWDDAAELWDSGKTSLTSCNENSRCEDITYAGSALADGTTYYWRIRFWDDSDAEGSWSATQQFSMNNAPTLTNVSLNGGSNISLTENDTTTISWTSTITDLDGYSDISSAEGVMYRSGVSGAEACTPSDADCYADADCTLSDCADNSCTATCQADVEFFADPTDTNSPYPSEYWLGWIKATDSNSETDEDTSDTATTDMQSLLAISVDASLAFGQLLPGEDTEDSNETTTVTNTGNRAIDIEVSGDEMCTDYPTCSGTTIPVGNLEFSLSGFTYNAGIDLTTGAQTLDMSIAQPSSNPSSETDIIYWGILIPDVIGTGEYSTNTTVTAIGDS